MLCEVNRKNNSERLMGRIIRMENNLPLNKRNPNFESELDQVINQVETYPQYLELINQRDHLMMEISNMANEVQRLAMKHSDITTELNTYLQETFYKKGMQSKIMTRDSEFAMYES